jgi:hypothetical protein
MIRRTLTAGRASDAIARDSDISAEIAASARHKWPTSAVSRDDEQSTMKALYKDKAGPGLILAERPEPTSGRGEVKIRVARTGICGTDLHIESRDAWAAGAITLP